MMFQQKNTQTDDESSSIVQSNRLKGHYGSILCLDYDNYNNNNLLVSGSEDKTCRIWDVHRQQHATHCIICPNQVQAVSWFYHGCNENNDQNNAIDKNDNNNNNSTATTNTTFAIDYSVYAAVDNIIYEYDLRMATSPIVKYDDDNETNIIYKANDEINQIGFAPPPPPPSYSIHQHEQATIQQQEDGGTTTIINDDNDNNNYNNNNIILASVDDSGIVYVRTTSTMHREDSKSCNTSLLEQEFCHGKDAMVTSMTFCNSANNHSNNDNNNDTYLATGGTDCRICLWDVTNQKKKSLMLSSITIPNTDAGVNQLCNPPMIHSLAYNNDNNILVAGLGDGSIAILKQQQQQQKQVNNQKKNKKNRNRRRRQNNNNNNILQLIGRIDNAHDSSIASVIFPQKWKNNNNNDNNVLLLCSAGNDQKIVVWDLLLNGDDKNDNDNNNNSNDNNDNVILSDQIQTKMNIKNDHNNRKQYLIKPKALFAIQHSAKPNWMVCSSSNNNDSSSCTLPPTLFVADTSNDITAITIPNI